MASLASLTETPSNQIDRVVDHVLKTADVAMFLDCDHVVREIARGEAVLALAGIADWPGHRLPDLVDGGTRPAVIEMLSKADALLGPADCDAVHPRIQGGGIPIHYRANRLGEDGQILVVGRDLSPLDRIEDRVREAQRKSETDNAERRALEALYRHLFEVAAEAVVIVTSEGLVQEVNPMAADLLGSSPERLAARPLTDLVAPAEHDAMEAFLGQIRRGGEAQPIVLTLAPSGQAVRVSGQVFRGGSEARLILRLVRQLPEPVTGERDAAQVLRWTGDAVMIADRRGSVLWANPEFLQMTGLAQHDLRDLSIGDLVSELRTGLEDFLAGLEHGGALTLGTVSIVLPDGARHRVDLSAVAMRADEQTIFGFIIRPLHHGGNPAEAGSADVADLVGQTPLRAIVRQSADSIERTCIRAALALTGNNRAAAAAALGLSRQSLYSKMRRFNLH